MKFYVLDENNNKVEAFDKEGTLAVLQQAINDGTLENIVADAAFVSKLKCCVSGDTHNMAFVTQAKYNELVAANGLLENTYYWITDDSTCEDLNETLEALTTAINDIGDFRLDVEKRLNELGFKEGAFTVSGISAENITVNSLKKQGKYVIANLAIRNTTIPSDINVVVPENFRPKENTYITVSAILNEELVCRECNVKADTGLVGGMYLFSTCSSATILNVGWEIA